MTKYYMSMSDKNMKKLVLYGKMSPYSQSHQKTSLYDLIWIGRMTKYAICLCQIKIWNIGNNGNNGKMAPIIHFLKAKCKYSISLFFI